MEKFQAQIFSSAQQVEIHEELHTKMPVRLQQGGVFICQSGSADIVIDLKRFHICKGDMVVAFPYTILQVLGHSEDFDGGLLAADVNFFASIQISDKSSHYLYVKENPCISLQEEEEAKILLLHDQLLRESALSAHPMRREIDECLMRVIVYEVAAIFLKRKPLVQQPHTRKERIFGQFIFSLYNHLQDHRSLEFYATEQSITPRHLSTIIKQMSGITAAEWIVTCTIAHIKTKLQDDQLSIAEISDALNFPNPSFFSQYFKKYAGVSPREFRAS